MDVVTPERRSAMMSRIRSRDTRPEMIVRRYLHSAGLRYRLHAKDLPGSPDVVFRRAKVCVFVHGCFWHGCPRCVDGRRKVKSNTTYWGSKIAGNRERDARHTAALQEGGWHVLTVWECEVCDAARLAALASEIAERRK
jgi:DNA mismatch endonuclease (patch repair protein)